MRRILNELFLCSDFDLPNRAASSEGDEHLAKLIFAEFEKQIMEPWTDEHCVQLQTPNRFDATHTHTNLWMLALGKVFLKVSVFFICSERKNCVSFGSAEFYPEGYLAYSATGTVTVRQQTFTPLNLGWLDLSESCCWS